MQPANTHTHTDIHTYIYMCTYIHLCLPIGFVHTLPHTHTYTQQATHRTAAAARKLRIRLVWRRQLKKCTKQKCAEKERVQQQVMANVQQQQGHTIYCICICIILCVRVCKLCMCSPRLAISGAFALELDELIMYVTYKRLLCVCVCANNSNNNYSKNNKSCSNYNNNNS